jgi:hypothetical protein
MTTIVTVESLTRKCGECQLCCKLLPVRTLQKKGGEVCRHQKFRKGCAVYHRAGMPPECAIWNCRWLVNDDADELSRPDRAHYVIDVMPDFVTLKEDATGFNQNIEVVQIWCDPKYPDAHRDPALRRWLFRRAQEGKAAIIRFNERDAIGLFAPPFDKDGKWHEITSGISSTQHTLTDIERALGGEAEMVIEHGEQD